MVGADELVCVGTNVSVNTVVGSIDSVGTMDGTEVVGTMDGTELIEGVFVVTSKVGDSVGGGGSTGIGVGFFDGLLVGLKLIQFNTQYTDELVNFLE